MDLFLQSKIDISHSPSNSGDTRGARLSELPMKEFGSVGIFSKYRNNFTLLSWAAEVIGKQYESRPYDELCGGAADESGGEYEYEGQRVRYSAYSYNIKSDGDVCFCVDIYSQLPTFFGIKPSYQFVKHPDGSVSHQ
jgi:hypothetical protein